ncbi:MAG TPA: hypothetical protein VLD58_07000 [Gemmatimonadales bacterium]|nr:hypothetical protein [Gemmatimonadales bacterium]
MRHLTWTVLIVAIAGCRAETDLTQPLERQAARLSGVQYRVVKLPTLGGSASRGNGINNEGWVAGFSDLADGRRHAALWRNDSIFDLGTLGGPNSNSPWPGVSNSGLIVGNADTPELDPLNEDWSCEAFMPASGHICRGFVWENGALSDLPTLGGNQGFATGVNSRGQVVGWAETAVHDPTCNSPQVLQFRAVMWEPRFGTRKELRPLPGDSASAATAINERGQVVGISGDCDVAVGRFSARHSVLWEGDSVIEIRNLGGVTWHTPMAINQEGDVVGFSNPPGPGDPDGDFIAHAFLWLRNRPDTIFDLHQSSQDAFSEALGINARRQVVGVTFGGSRGTRAFLWQDGVMTDLNDLVAPSSDVLVSAQDINDTGQITGRVRDGSTGKVVAFIATPIADVP